MQSDNRQKILDGCDRCVLCGLCLPHCPTYQLERNESESPRGRIVFIQALMRGDLNPQKSDLGSLDHCLLCRSCEAACPSQVPYGEIMALTRDQLKPKQSQLIGQLMDAVAKPEQIPKMLSKLRLYQKSGLQKLVQGSGLLKGTFKEAEGLLRFSSTDRLRDYYPAKLQSRGEMPLEVQLFTGCMGESFDQQTIKDGITLLNAFGFGVKIGHPASCCGAMHHHNGDLTRSAELKRNAVKKISGTKTDAVLGLASSCVARVNENDDDESSSSPQVTELTEFLVKNIGLLDTKLSGINRRIALHQPCPNKNLLKNFDQTIELLNKIPQLEILRLPTYGCCGASGIHMVSDSEHARKFLAETIQWLKSEKPDLILSQNMGCMFHITTEIEREKMNIKVMHPISLLLSAINPGSL